MRRIVAVLILPAACGAGQTPSSIPTTGSTIEARFAAPAGSERVPVEPSSFASYLRQYPLKPAGTPVLLYNGTPKHTQEVHAAVADLSTGSRDLQQCADAVMRLRAEYLFANGRQDEIAFDFTSGFRAEWVRWRKGERIRVKGNACSWYGGAAPDGSHAQLHKYLDIVFSYAGSLSLSKELQVAAGKPLQAGDVFIQGGSPGHAVLVLDVARHPDGRTFFLLGQSYMPAQDFHVLKNPAGGTWFVLDQGSQLRTPEWTFGWSDRKRWVKP